MARSARKKERTGPTEPAGRRSGTAKTLIGMAVIVVVAIVGVIVIRSQAGPGRRVVDVEALAQQEQIRNVSLQRIAQCEDLMSDGKMDEAVQLLQQVIVEDPNFYIGSLLLGYAYMRLGKLPLADQLTRRAYALEPNDFAVDFQMGQIEVLLGQMDFAIDHLTQAIRLRREAGQPPAPEYHITLADAYARNRQPELAADEMEIALNANREEATKAAGAAGPQAQIALARAMVRRKEMAEAARLFAQAAEQQPDRAEWQFLAARAYYVQGKFEQAAPFIQRAIDLDPSNGAYVQLKRKIDARDFASPDEGVEASNPREGGGPSELDPFKR
jgi:tetratricopeptide (TPR) repeat protein